METSKLNDIIKSIEQDEKEIELILSDISIKRFSNLLRIINNYEKTAFNLRKGCMKNQLTLKVNSLEKKENYLNEVCTFDFDIIMKFITNALSIIEEKNYQLNYFYLASSYPSLKSPKKDEEKVCLIALEKNMKMILDIYNTDGICDSDDLDDELLDEKYILLETNNRYKVFDYYEKQVSKSLTKINPVLSVLIVDLINHKIENPNITEQQAAYDVLQEIPERHPYLIENNIFCIKKNTKSSNYL